MHLSIPGDRVEQVAGKESQLGQLSGIRSLRDFSEAEQKGLWVGCDEIRFRASVHHYLAE